MLIKVRMWWFMRHEDASCEIFPISTLQDREYGSGSHMTTQVWVNLIYINSHMTSSIFIVKLIFMISLLFILIFFHANEEMIRILLEDIN